MYLGIKQLRYKYLSPPLYVSLSHALPVGNTWFAHQSTRLISDITTGDEDGMITAGKQT